MTTVTKLAISLPTKTAATLEKLRAKKRLTRSAAITEAVDRARAGSFTEVGIP